MMKTLHMLFACAFCAMVATVIAGCGAAGGGGYGADAGPWGQSPARTQPTQTARPPAEQVPDAVIVVQLRGKAAENEVLKLDIAQIELKYQDQWAPVTNREAIAKIETLPLAITQQGYTALLATPKTKAPRRKYTHLRLRFDDAKTAFVRDAKEVPLTVQASALDLGEWTPDDKAINTLLVTLDGTKVTATASSATLPSGALAVAKKTATAGISGKILPASPTARVDALWGQTKVVIGTAIPAAADGTFQIANLPAGSYRLEVTHPGYHQADEDKKPIVIEEKLFECGEVKLLKD